MYSKFAAHIASASFFDPSMPVLLAVSGGRDSVVLAHLMSRTSQPFAVAHCNFNLRPGDCDRDEAFVKALSDSLGVPCHVAHFDTRSYAHDHHLSIEAAARDLRYGFFAQLVSAHGYSGVATGHHRDDAVETFFINLLRGTGIAGLHGIRPQSVRLVPTDDGSLPLAIFRPLLPFSRAEIDAYVEQQGLAFVEDYTNAELEFRRNQVRHQLMPLLRQMSPHIDESMQSTMSALADAEQLYRDQLRLLAAQHLSKEGNHVAISYDSIRQLSPQFTVLFELLRPYGFNAVQIADILAGLDRQVGTEYLSPTHRLVFDYSGLLIVPKSAPTNNPPRLIREQLSRGQFQSLKVPAHQLILDADKLSEPLSLRHPRVGDRFRPFGMKGRTQLLSDYFKDHHVSVVDRDSKWLLVDAQDRILWVVGHRASELCSVTPSTTNILRITVQD